MRDERFDETDYSHVESHSREDEVLEKRFWDFGGV